MIKIKNITMTSTLFYYNQNVRSLICFIMQIITNRKEVDKGLSYEKYNAISNKDHIKKILKMPVHYLLESGKGFFVKKEGAALALKDEMQEVIDNPVFIKQMKDVVEYRIMDYYRRRYKEKGN